MKTIKTNISKLLFELTDVYVRAKCEDNNELTLFETMFSQSSNKNIVMSDEEFELLKKICGELADRYTYDSMHSSTKRGFQILYNKLLAL